MICDASYPLDKCLEELASFNYRHDQVSRVSTKKVWYSRCQNYKFTVVAIDCGCKLNIIRMLNQFKCNVVVVPFDTTAEKILSYKPDGLFISNGPGDPIDVTPVIETIKTLKGKLPMLGICLGHQMIGLAYGAKTYKMKFGHRGANHPVKNLLNGKVEITSQNHSFAIDKNSLEGTGLELTHVNVIDGELEGVRDVKNHVMSIQYHPESAAGPEDSEYLFNQFIDLLHDFGGNKNA
jgi:carbamoyl-phosphate synthase small subunit